MVPHQWRIKGAYMGKDPNGTVSTGQADCVRAVEQAMRTHGAVPTESVTYDNCSTCTDRHQIAPYLHVAHRAYSNSPHVTSLL